MKTHELTPNDRRWEIRDLAREFHLRHSDDCRKANNVGAPKGEGRFPFRCECDFFEKIEKARAGDLVICHRVLCSKHGERVNGWLPDGWHRGEHGTYCSTFCLGEIEHS